jgi:hypothetical protein
MFERKFNPTFAAIAIVVVCIMAFLLVMGVIALTRGRQAVDLIRVPGDYPTIQAAVNAAEAGDIIQVSAGVYNENVTLDKPVALTAENFDAINPVNNGTVIDGMGGAFVISIPSGMTQMPTVSGFVIRNSNIGIQAASNFVAEYNYLHSSVILVSYQAGSGGVNRNNVYFNSTDDAIRLDDVNRPLLIENNRILYAGDDGIEVSLQNATAPAGRMEVNIWNNMIIGNAQDGVQLIDYAGDPQDTNRLFVLRGNLIANNGRAGLGFMPNANMNEDFSGADVIEDVHVINNTFYGNNHGVSGGDNLVAFNNIIVNSTARGSWRVQGPPGMNSVIAYTLFFGNAVDAEQTTLGGGNIIGQDPLFQARPNPGPDGIWGTVDDDFSGLLLQPGSPAVDKGVTQHVASDGELVPSSPITGYIGAAPDLGWRELGSPAIMTPTPSASPTATLLTPVTATSTPTFTATAPSATQLSATPTQTATVGSPSPVATSTSTVTITPAPPGGTATATLGVQTVVPATVQAGTTVQLTITGSGFSPGAIVSFEGGQGAASQVTSVQFINSNTLIVTVNAMSDSSFGTQTWDVRVTNPNTTTILFPDSFTVTP